MLENQNLVSVIMPAYNCENFIKFSLDSVLAQVYENWELIIVDDCSTDNTKEIINSYMKKDKRIKYYRLNENSGAAIARNKAVEKAKGEFIAFLDSDDIWHPEKLVKQIKFMNSKQINFSCTSYLKIDENGNLFNRVVKAEKKSGYNDLLKTAPGNSTVMYNAYKLGKFYIPKIKKRNDYVMWLKIIRSEGNLYGLDENLASHRVRKGSISSNKISLLKYHWIVYRRIENLTLVKSIYLTAYWSIKGLKKFFKIYTNGSE